MMQPSLPPDIVRGPKGNLFLVGGAQSVYEYVSGEREIRPGIVRIFRDNLIERNSYCESINAQYHHVVCPDKHTVVCDDFPLPVKVSVASRFLDICGNIFSLPTHALQNSFPNPCYWLTDTHWNLFGYLVFVQHSLENLGFDNNNIAPILKIIQDNATSVSSYCGDLGIKLSPRPTEAGFVLTPNSNVLFVSNNVTGNNGTINVTINLAVPRGRLLMFGDSFAMGSIKIFALFFREIFFLRSPYFHKEIASMFKPTHVLTSNVERYLPGIPTDREAPVALYYKDLLNKDSKPDSNFYKTVDAVLQPGSLNYERFFANI